MTTLRVALIGVGHWGPKLLSIARAHPDVALTACCDVDPRRLTSIENLEETRVTTSLDDVLADPEIDAVLVATPAATHHGVARQALLAGKHVFVEKPLATNAADAADLGGMADRFRRTLMVGHLFAYHPAIVRLLDLIRAGHLGQIRYVHSVRTSMSGTARLDTSIVWDALVHDAYLLSALFGERPVQVSAAGRSYLNTGIEDVVQATFDFGGTRLACCFASWYSVEKARRMTIVGSDRMAVYDDLAPDGSLAVHDCKYVADGDANKAGRRRMIWRDDGFRCLEPGPHDPLRTELDHFFTCARTGERPRTSGREGLDAVMVLEALNESIAQGGRLIPIAPASVGANAPR